MINASSQSLQILRRGKQHPRTSHRPAKATPRPTAPTSSPFKGPPVSTVPTSSFEGTPFLFKKPKVPLSGPLSDAAAWAAAPAAHRLSGAFVRRATGRPPDVGQSGALEVLGASGSRAGRDAAEVPEKGLTVFGVLWRGPDRGRVHFL